MRSISITSGKGGVGKTAVSANLGILLAQRGFRTAIFDCDFGLANLALNIGLEPRRTLQDVVNQDCSIMEALSKGPSGVRVLAGCSGVLGLAKLEFEKLESLSLGFSELEQNFDFLLLDNAAGLSDGVMSVSSAADEVLLVFTPEPSSMMDAYASIKLLFQRRPGALVNCVVNQVKNEREAKALFKKMNAIVRDFLRERITYAGFVRKDDAMSRAARLRKAVVVHEPRSHFAQDLKIVAAEISGSPHKQSTKTGFFSRLFSRRPVVA